MVEYFKWRAAVEREICSSLRSCLGYQRLIVAIQCCYGIFDTW